jgi:hypothetical protein
MGFRPVLFALSSDAFQVQVLKANTHYSRRHGAIACRWRGRIPAASICLFVPCSELPSISWVPGEAYALC